MASATSRAATGVWWPVLFSLLLVFCAWRALGIGMADWWARQNPEAALQWRPDHAEAALQAAEVAVYSDPRSEAVARWSRQAISSYPLDGRPYRLLADTAGMRVNLGKALHEIAAERSPRDYLSQAWVINAALQTRDFRRAVGMLDRMLRARPEIAHHLTPVLAGIASTPEAQPALADALAKNPPWREPRFGSIVEAASSGQALTPLMRELRARTGGVTPQEQAAWINRLLRDGQYGFAYLAWIESLSPEQQQRIGNVYDGGFELLPSGAAFEWQLRGANGVQVDRAHVDDGSGTVSLRIVFDERSRDAGHVGQMLLLAPGSYRFGGRSRMLGIDEGAGLVWRISCTQSGKSIAQSSGLSGSHDWRGFSVDFVVPTQGCEAQQLSLARPVVATSSVAGVAAFDDLTIEKRYAPIVETARF